MVNIISEKIVIITAVVLIFLQCSIVFAQDYQFQPDKPGKFILQNKLNKCPGLDITFMQKKLTAITEWIRKNDSTVNQPVGNDALISFSGNLCDKSKKTEDFGVQCGIYFSFHHFWIENGVSFTATGNTAHGTSLLINNPISLISTQFTETGFQASDPPHLKQPLEKALGNLKMYYTTAPVIKEIALGVRLYAEGGWFKGVLLVFNPNRPDIWIPVTVKEIMEAKLAYYKIKQEIDSINYEKMLSEWAKMNFKPQVDQMMRPMLYNVIKKEYENFTADELKSPAFSSADEQSGTSTINAHGQGRQVVKFNPACWDRTLPPIEVQFISMEYRPATTYELLGFKQRNDGLVDYVGLFYNNLPVEKMGELIQRK